MNLTPRTGGHWWYKRNKNSKTETKPAENEDASKTETEPDHSAREIKTIQLINEDASKTEDVPDLSPNDASIKYVRAKESDEMVKSAKKKKFKDKHVSFEMDHIDKHYER